jgi:hypothetical protein
MNTDSTEGFHRVPIFSPKIPFNFFKREISSFSGAFGSVPGQQRPIGQSPLSGNPQTSHAKPHVLGIFIPSSNF